MWLIFKVSSKKNSDICREIGRVMSCCVRTDVRAVCHRTIFGRTRILTYIMEISVELIASLAGGTVEGDKDALITGFAKIEEARPGSLTFIANPKYAHCIHTTQATAVLVSNDFDPEGECKPTLIRVADPYATLAKLLSAMEQKPQTPVGVEQPAFVAEGVTVPEDAYVGAFSYISKGARIGKGVKIYPNCFVGEGAEIDDYSIIRAGVKIYEGCKIGKRCILHSGVVIGADGFGFAPGPDGYAKIPQVGNVVLEDDVEIGANTTVDRATFGSTRVGRGTKLDNLIQVAHNVELGKNNVIAAQTGIAGSAKMGDWNRIGGQVGFAGHITIGNANEFGAQTGVPHSIGDNKRMIGYPAVDLHTFARNIVYMNRLHSLFTEVNRLTKELDTLKKGTE